MEAIDKWLHPKDRDEGAQRLERLERHLSWFCDSLRLSNAQKCILEALIRVAPAYRRAQEADDIIFLEGVASAPEFRLLLPSLQRLGERFDGQGVRRMGNAPIPLLARVLDVLLAIDEETAEPLVRDRSRYDPSSGLVEEMDRAA